MAVAFNSPRPPKGKGGRNHSCTSRISPRTIWSCQGLSDAPDLAEGGQCRAPPSAMCERANTSMLTWTRTAWRRRSHIRVRPESAGLPATPHGKGGGHGQRSATEPGKALEGTVRNAVRTNIAKEPPWAATVRGSESAVIIKSVQVDERPDAGKRRTLSGVRRLRRRGGPSGSTERVHRVWPGTGRHRASPDIRGRIPRAHRGGLRDLGKVTPEVPPQAERDCAAPDIRGRTLGMALPLSRIRR